MRRKVHKKYKGPRVPGIDVSHWQGDIPWAKVKSDPEVRFAILRLGDGEDTDDKIEQNAAACRDANIRRGFYHYVRLDRTAEEQARTILDIIELIGGFERSDMVPFLDVEGRPDDPRTLRVDEGTGSFKNVEDDGVTVTPQIALRRLWELVKILTAEWGVTPGIYTGQTWHHAFSKHDRYAPQLSKFWLCPFWTPWYVLNQLTDARLPATSTGDPAPWDLPHIHQWTGSGSVAGIKKVDRNNFLGTEKQLVEELCFGDRMCI